MSAADDYRKQQDLLFQEMEDRAAIAKEAEANADLQAIIDRYGMPNILKAYRATLKAGGAWDMNQFVAHLIANEAAKPSKP